MLAEKDHPQDTFGRELRIALTSRCPPVTSAQESMSDWRAQGILSNRALLSLSLRKVSMADRTAM
jgi:hypothetical protein